MGGSSRIHGHDLSSSESCLVFDEVSHLPESPRAVAATLSFPNRCLAAYAFQLFQDDCASSVFRFHHQLLADDMVHVSSMVGFASAELFQMAGRPVSSEERVSQYPKVSAC